MVGKEGTNAKKKRHNRKTRVYFVIPDLLFKSMCVIIERENKWKRRNKKGAQNRSNIEMIMKQKRQKET